MQQIKLTRGLVALVDDEDFEALNSFRWHANVSAGPKFYASRKARTSEGPRTIIYMHKVIMPTTTGVVDHINGDTLDNRRSNLRIVSQSVNLASGGNPSGVFYCTMTKRWAARVSFEGKRIFLGRFDSEAAAVAAAEGERVRLGIRVAR